MGSVVFFLLEWFFDNIGDFCIILNNGIFAV